MLTMLAMLQVQDMQGMGRMMSGMGILGMLIGVLIGVLMIVVLVLLIIFLAKQIRK